MGAHSTRTARHTIATLTVGAVLGLAACTGVSPEAASDVIAAHVASLGIDPALVYTTYVDGYDLAPQSVNEVEGGGMSATWVNADTGDIIALRVGAGELTDASCAALPMWGFADGDVACTADADVWHRTGEGVEEYAVARDGAIVRVVGGDGYGAPAEDLLDATRGVRVPSERELERLFADARARTAGEPVDRGDLPEHGDGAPIDEIGEGG